MSAGAPVPFSGGRSFCLCAVISPLKRLCYSLCSRRRKQTCNYSLPPEPFCRLSPLIISKISKYHIIPARYQTDHMGLMYALISATFFFSFFVGTTVISEFSNPRPNAWLLFVGYLSKIHIPSYMHLCLSPSFNRRFTHLLKPLSL